MRMKNDSTDPESKLKGHLLHQLLVTLAIHAQSDDQEITYLNVASINLCACKLSIITSICQMLKYVLACQFRK